MYRKYKFYKGNPGYAGFLCRKKKNEWGEKKREGEREKMENTYV